jgi:nicotinamide-nucleotide amidase
MYLEWFFKEKAAGEKSLEEVVVDLLAERKLLGILLNLTSAKACHTFDHCLHPLFTII